MYIPPILAVALIYGLTPEEAAAWAGAVGTVATVVVGVIENLILRVGGALLRTVRGWTVDVAAGVDALAVRVAAVESRQREGDGRDAGLASTVEGLSGEVAALKVVLEGLKGKLEPTAAKVAAIEAVTPHLPAAGASS